MAMAGPIPMHIDRLDSAALLTLTQWLSPSFPIGAFSYSHGLEYAVHSGSVADSAGFEAWIMQMLRHGAGRNDAILVCAAYHAAGSAELADVDALARALCPSSERLLETVEQGAAFAATTSDVWGLNLPPLSLPAAVGAAAAARRIPLDPTLRLYLHAMAGNLTSAAIRLIPLGQTEGQRVLAGLSDLVDTLAEEAQAATLDDLGATAFAIDIASMRHETQYSRMFRS